MPGSATTTTPVDTQLHAELDTSIGDVDVDVNVTGSLTATWSPTIPVDTAAGIFSDVVVLSLAFDLRFVENDFDSDVTVNETIEFVLARPGPVTLLIANPAGRIVRTLSEASLDAGPHHAEWDGKDDAGRDLPAGIYLFVLHAGEQHEMGKLVRVR